MSITTKRLRIIVIALWVLALLASFMWGEAIYRLFSFCVAICAALLIYSARGTQGHYRNISQAYMLGSLIWAFDDLLRIVADLSGSELIKAAALNISFLPLIFFCGGLILFAHSEYNSIHFQKMTLHTFGIAFFIFMVAQKLLLVNYGKMSLAGIKALCGMIYFFIAVFTVTFIIAIFFQTNFKGHTRGTNLSALILIEYCCLELDRLYRLMSGDDFRWLFFDAIGLLGLVIYSWAQSDPQLINREVEPDELKPDEQISSVFIWCSSIIFLLLGFVLYAYGFFDTRDIYFLIIAVLSYATIYKSLQASVYNTLRLKHQMEENQRLEEMVEEKTRELRLANEELKLMSNTDALTGLYNRRYAREFLQGLADNEEVKTFAFMLLDLNHFKQVNDNYGHEVGDQVLEEVGRRMRSFDTPGVTSIRLGGDEFVVVLEEQEGWTIRESAEAFAARMCRVMDEPIHATVGDLVCTACIGIGIWPENTEDIDVLYQLTDEAMYDIKHNKDKSVYKFVD